MTFLLSGFLASSAIARNFSGAAVEAWDASGEVSRPYATGTVGRGGAFSIAFSTAAATAVKKQSKGLDLRVSYQGALLRLVQPVIWRPGDPTEGLQLAVRVGEDGRDPDGGRSVYGRVTGPDGRGLAGLVMRAADRDLRREQPLGETRTAADGSYAIGYSAAAFTRAEKTAADLVVRIFDSAGKTLLHEPEAGDVLFQAPSELRHDIRLAAAPRAELADYDAISAALEPLLEGLDPADLTEDKNNRDVSFLSGETGWPADRIEHFIVAHQMSRAIKGEPALFYALLQMGTLIAQKPAAMPPIRVTVGIGSDTDSLLRAVTLIPDARIRQDVKQAVDRNLIAKGAARKLPELVNKLAELVDGGTEKDAEDRRNRYLALAEKLLRRENIDQIERLLATPQKDLQGLLREILSGELFDLDDAATADSGAKPDAKMVRFAAASGAAHLAEMAVLRTDDEGALARLPVSALRKAMQRAAPDLGEAALDRQAKRMARTLRARHPDAAFTARLAEDKPPVSDPRRAIEIMKRIGKLDLKRSNLDRAFARAKADKPADRALLAEMKTLQRVLKLAPDLDRSEQLIASNLRSAADIVAMGHSRFMAEAAPQAGLSQTEARQTYARAMSAHTAALMIAGEARDLVATAPAAAPTTSIVALTAATDVGFPNIASLFKATDLCQCKHCRSVLSPAAYLVELIEFLGRRSMIDLTQSPPARINLAREELFGRRPEIADLDLDCANAETPLPYIDLVCEILEQEIAPDPGIVHNGAVSAPTIGPAALLATLRGAGWRVSDSAIVQAGGTPGELILRDLGLTAKLVNTGGNSWRVFQLRQTRSLAAELSAAPEHVNPGAYSALKAARYAFALPFDLDHVEALAYLGRFGAKRADLMDHFATAAGPSSPAIASERLGLTAAQAALVTTPAGTAAGQSAVWAIPAAAVVPAMTIVATFLDRTGIDYAALDRLLQLDFIDPDDRHFIRHLDLSCDLEQKEIAGLDLALLDRIHRFLRLQRATGWADTVLDAALTDPAIGAGTLDDAALVNLARLDRIAKRCGINPEQLTACFGRIAHAQMTGTTALPLYHRIFLDKSLLSTVIKGLHPDAVAANTGSLATLAGPLSALLKLTAEGFEALRAGLTDDVLSFGNLSRLYAAARLVAGLKLAPEDLLLMHRRTGLDPFAGPAQMLSFLDRVETTRSGAIKIGDLPFMLEHAGSDLSRYEIADHRIVAILTDLQIAYQAAFAETRSTFDAAKTAEEHRAPIKEALLRLPAVDTEGANTILRMYDAGWTSPPDPMAGATIAALLSGYFDTAALVAAQAAVAAAAPAALETARLAMADALLGAIATYLHGEAKAETLAETLAATYRQDGALVRTVLDHAELTQPGPGTPRLADLLTDNALIDTVGDPAARPAVTTAAYPAQARALKLLHKILPVAATLALEPDDLDWLLSAAPDLGWVRLDALPYQAGQAAVALADWEGLIRAVALFRVYPDTIDPANSNADITLRDTLDLIRAGAATTRAQWLDRLGLLIGCKREVLEVLDSHFGWSIPNLAAWRNPATWDALSAALVDLQTTTLSPTEAIAVAQPAIGAAETSSLRTALKARYDDAIWLVTLAEITNTIRPMKRDALVAYLLAERPEFATATDLYDHFLIDVEMDAKMPSSRIVQAYGTIQTFVERSRMGIEPKAAADSADSGWRQWSWMRNYRVWEANRKVWVHPENWIEPELLDDKSELFVAMEEELLQNEVTESTTENAYARYLERLDDISFLEVVAVFYQADTSVMHVFARTKGGDPAQYYYRTFEKERYWSPWRLVELDITSDNLVAFVRNGRLNLAWPVIREESDPSAEVITPAVSNAPSIGPMQHPAARLRVQMAISELADGLWKPKRISQDAVLAPLDYTTDRDELDSSRLNIMYSELSDQIFVFRTHEDNDENYHALHGIFNVAGCKGYPEVVSNVTRWFPDFYPDYKDTRIRKQRYIEGNFDKEDTLAIRNVLTPWGFVVRLDKTPGTFRVTHPHQFTALDLVYTSLQLWLLSAYGQGSATYSRQVKIPLGTWLPYFFENSRAAYVVVPGLYSADPEDPTQRTASDFLQFLRDLLALARKYLAILRTTPPPDPEDVWEDFVDDPDFARLTGEMQVYQKLEYGEKFANLYHPLICPLRKTLHTSGVGAMMNRAQQLQITGFDFEQEFKPAPMIVRPYPIEDVDFTPDGAYSPYNWELFFHAPLMIARRLASEQRFEEAMRWYHRIFDPTGTLEGDVPQKYWVTKPFFLRAGTDYLTQRIDTILTNLADPLSPERHELEFAISQWREKPFRPHVVARFRTVAYQRTVVMNYIGTLIDWGDYLFRQDTMESITQAIQLYQLADKLLGKKPSTVPPPVNVTPMTYAQLAADLDAFGNALVDLENLIPDLTVLPESGDELPPPPTTLASLYFCIPPNDKALEYWDIVADRLFKIRNSQNIDGVERVLALFAPPIDPGMLVRAAASGIDMGSLLAGLAAPLPPYRFRVMVARASQLSQEVRALGNALLSALERKDAEALALLRNDLEVTLLKAQRELKVMEIDAADAQIAVLARTREMTAERQTFYAGFEMINANESLHLDKLREAQDFQNSAQIVRATGAVLGFIPDFTLGGHGAGGSPAVHATFGGSTLAQVADAAATVLAMISGISSYQATRAATLGGFDRRWDDAQLQLRLIDKELMQIDQQIVTAQMRRDIAARELDVHDIQIGNAEDLSRTMSEQYTNTQLYQWMSNEITKVYYSAYKLAFDTARKAEQCYRHELGSSDSFLDFGYWDSRKKGLQSANKLIHDINRMEARYHAQNQREYELTKHVSLRRLDPLALARLTTTGTCTFEVPEALFDLDHPGQYFRRIRSVAISIPCVAGPFAAVNARLTQVSNRYRASTAKAAGAGTPKEEYEESAGNDPRFVYNVGVAQSVATSSGQNDAGVFELDFRDDRYLPFEGTGAAGGWRLELPAEIRQFDYATISDVILHVRYTAREGGTTLRGLATASLVEKLQEIGQELSKTGLHVVHTLRRDDFNAWHLLKSTGTANVTIRTDHLPYFVQDKGLSPRLGPVTLLARVAGDPASYTVAVDGGNVALNFLGAMRMNVNDVSGPMLDTAFALTIAPGDLAALRDLTLVAKLDFT